MNAKTPPSPTPEQHLALGAMQSGASVMITGPAGTGKSFVLDRAKELFRSSLAVTATTGIAALNVSGITIHSWAGLGMGEDPAKIIAGRIIGQRGKTFDQMIAAKTLAIDEASMLAANLLTVLDHVMRLVRKNQKPFGGVQLVLIGDFLQLPPVVKFDASESKPQRFAFHSPSWMEAGIQVHQLRTIVRQKDAAFASMLNRVRIGRIDAEVRGMLEARVLAHDDTPTIKPIQLQSYNATADAINTRELSMIKGTAETYRAEDIGQPAALETIRKHCIAPELLTLKIGAQVMLLRNIDTESGLVNGAMGKVVEINPRTKIPVVQFANGQKHWCDPEKWEMKRNGEVLASRTQIPLRLAWAITIHKCQGMTLDKVEADLQNVFEYGQAYVALSRCKTYEGLFLTGLDVRKIRADPDALRFYGFSI